MKKHRSFLTCGWIIFIALSVSAQNDYLNEKTVTRYLEAHFSSANSWWLIEDGKDSALAGKIVQLIDYFGRFKGKIPPTTELGFFLAGKPTFRFGYLFDDSVYYPASINGPNNKAELSICFVPFHYRNDRPFASYDQKEKRLVFLAVDCPKNIFAAFFFGGLQSAALGSTKNDLSLNRSALKTAADILDRASEYLFFNYLDSVLAAHRGENPLEQISVDDLKNIDTLVGAEKMGLELAQAILPVYVEGLKYRLMMLHYRQQR